MWWAIVVLAVEKNKQTNKQRQQEQNKTKHNVSSLCVSVDTTKLMLTSTVLYKIDWSGH